MTRLQTLLLLLFLCCGFHAVADVTLVVEFDKTTTGSTTEVVVSATSDSADMLQSFTIPIDVGGDGYAAGSLPAGFAFGSPVFSSAFSPTGVGSPGTPGSNTGWFADAQLMASGSDIYVKMDTGTAVTLDVSKTTLFSLRFNVTAPTGTMIPVNVVDSNFLFDIASPSGSLMAQPTTNGQIEVLAVPEPNAIAFFSVILVVVGTISRWRTNLSRSRFLSQP